MSFQSWFAISALFLVSINQSIADGGDVPLSGSRGSYEGAENIHWYMQDTLRSQTFEEALPFVFSYYQCNSLDESKSCEGHRLKVAVPVYAQNSRAWIKVAVLVDDRIDFSFRFALKQIRDTNRIFDRSGIRARLFVSEIINVSMETTFNDNPLFAYEELSRLRVELTAENQADIVIAMFKESLDYPVDFCGTATRPSTVLDIGVAVINCRYGDWTVAHEIGHTLGLNHDRINSNGADVPFVETGYGYIEPTTGFGSIMSYAGPGKVLPFFSSPTAFFPWNGERLVLGSEDENAVAAVNAAVVLISNANEYVHGRLPANGSMATSQEELKKSWPSGKRPEPVAIYD